MVADNKLDMSNQQSEKGVGLETNATGQEMTNQQFEKATLSNIRQSWNAVEKLVPTSNFAASLFLPCTIPV